jgi:3-hydroxyisobutyrate dehydrogenase/2-hydroxy-3-oxopropionate reductase
MAANVLKRGHRLAVWNRTRSRAEPLSAGGARVASSPADAARGAEVVVTMLADPAAVRSVIASAGGVLEALEPGALVVDMSTVDPATAREMAALVKERGGRFVDAPVSGTLTPAVEGTLVIFAGGEPDDVERVRPVLEAMGRMRRVGPVGCGMALKLVLNGLGSHMLTGFTASLVLGVQQGLEPRLILEAIQAGAFSSPLYATKGERILAGNFRPDFTLALMLKDQELVLGAARRLDYPMPTQAAIRDVLRQAVDAGFGAEDLSSLVRLFETWAGVSARDLSRS